ncbi:hypothetical protein AXF42_Ash000796 [Apostasia shenzhenica]|uniref:Uncharacterized protein n=1 Tax=Apostasia shenzhenica TaxID=1088818 RepID=A0A2I0AT26_9ASPA|nr:hypothetical protein AXF42_Ash000796 [Apostasia shenzhenica]
MQSQITSINYCRIYSELSFEEIRAGGQVFLAGTAAGGCVRRFLHRSESSRWLRLRFKNDSEIRTVGHGFHRRHGSRRLRSAFFHCSKPGRWLRLSSGTIRFRLRPRQGAEASTSRSDFLLGLLIVHFSYLFPVFPVFLLCGVYVAESTRRAFEICRCVALEPATMNHVSREWSKSAHSLSIANDVEKGRTSRIEVRGLQKRTTSFTFFIELIPSLRSERVSDIPMYRVAPDSNRSGLFCRFDRTALVAGHNPRETASDIFELENLSSFLPPDSDHPACRSSLPFSPGEKMSWSHPFISLEDLMDRIKGFVEILVLASGCQSSGFPAIWDVENVKKAVRWGLFFEDVSLQIPLLAVAVGALQVMKSLRRCGNYADSVKELDAALSKLTSDPNFPPGLAHLSSQNLCNGTKLILERLLQTHPLKDELLVSFLRAVVEMDVDEFVKLNNYSPRAYINKLTLQLDSEGPAHAEKELTIEAKTLLPEDDPSSFDCVKNGDQNLWLCNNSESRENIVVECLRFVVQEILERQSAMSCLSSIEKGLDGFSKFISGNNLMELKNVQWEHELADEISSDLRLCSEEDPQNILHPVHLRASSFWLRALSASHG